ncbi:serpin B10-like [Paramacrobiotus metropolitanus]|uniref:serpin B10-like n=1 Tax=Paramacrobiotus metropolitanus TaxID=2943436 RepID=UPI00244592C1|nr:serpin B10-like [Paramacrobiotus metropolitanus]
MSTTHIRHNLESNLRKSARSDENSLTDLLRAPDTGSTYKNHMVNGAFVEKHFPIRESYLSEFENSFGALCQSVSFVPDGDNDDDGVARVNEFVMQHTRGKIRDILSPSDVNDQTRLILVNALYFKANWEKQFIKERAIKKPFTTVASTVVMGDTMHVVQECNYYESKELGGAKFLQLSYSGDLCSAYFVLPGQKKIQNKAKHLLSACFHSPDEAVLPEDSDHGLKILQQSLTPAKLFSAIQNMSQVTYGTVQLSKFCLEKDLEMEQMLKDLGMPSAFLEMVADFSGISAQRLCIDKVKQKAFIDVNEKGTEAAAATVITMINCCLPFDTRAEFIADRPSIIFIRHHSTNAILFFGHVTDPSA